MLNTLKSHKISEQQEEVGYFRRLAVPSVSRQSYTWEYVYWRNHLGVIDGLNSVDERCTLKFPLHGVNT